MSWSIFVYISFTNVVITICITQQRTMCGNTLFHVILYIDLQILNLPETSNLSILSIHSEGIEDEFILGIDDG